MQNFKDTFETRKLSFIIFHFSIYMSVPLIIIIYRQIFERTNLHKKKKGLSKMNCKEHFTAHKTKLSIKDFFSKYEDVSKSTVSCRFGHIYWANS